MSTETDLRALATPRDANERLAHEWRAGRWPVGLPLPRVQTVRCLRLHPGSRCTFRYSIEGWAETECIAKVYARSHPSATQTLTPLLAAEFGKAGRHRVPQVIADLPALHLVLLRVAAGSSVADLLRAGDLEAAARTGEWLGAFHAAPLAQPSAYAVRDPCALAVRWTARLAHALSDLANCAGTLCAGLLQARIPWPSDVRLIHGDFVAEHIIVANETTTVIDWDSCRVGDPAEDAGRFIASLWHLATRGRVSAAASAQAERRFRNSYSAVQPQIAARVPFYVALACLYKASRIAVRGERQRHQASALLAAGLTALDSTG